jgi:hypothetical protein
LTGYSTSDCKKTLAKELKILYTSFYEVLHFISKEVWVLDRTTAIQEINFIKKLLEETGKQIVRSGWVFIWVGIALFVALSLLGFILNFFYRDENVITIAAIVAIVLEMLAGILIYHRTVGRWSSATLEKQVWQIWAWAIFITFVLYGITFKAGTHLFSITLNLVTSNDINIAILVALVATGILTSKPFFFKLTIVLIIINIIMKILLANFSFLFLLSGVTNVLLPFGITGVYFLLLQNRRLKEEISHGVK